MNHKPTPRQSKADFPAAFPDTPTGAPHDEPTLFGSDATDPSAPDVQPAPAVALGDAGRGPTKPLDQVTTATASPAPEQEPEPKADPEPEPKADPEPEPDPFDPAQLSLSQDFAATVGVKKLLTTVLPRNPSKEWFVRTHPDPSYRLATNVVELKEDREMYLVAPALWEELASEPTFGPRLLITAINRQGNLFIWPVKLPGPDGT